MRAVLVFDLPDDECRHLRAVRAEDYFAALCAVGERLRRCRKYEGDSLSRPQRAIVQQIEAEFWEEMRERNIDLDDARPVPRQAGR